MNRYVQLNPIATNLYTPPVDLVGKAMELTQQRYDRNQAIVGEIQNQFIPSLPQDRKRANELQDYYSNQVEQIVNKYRGDYSQASNDLTQLLFRIKKDYGPGGEAGAIIGNYQNYQNWAANSQDLIKKGNVLGEDFNLAHNYYMQQYQGIGQRDPNTGSFNVFSPETLTEYADPEQIVQDVAAKTKPQKFRRLTTQFKNGLKEEAIVEHNGVTPERLYPGFVQALTTDPKYMNYLRQRAKFTGLDPNQLPAAIDSFARSRAQSLSYMDDIQEQRLDRDPLALLYTKHRLQQEANQELVRSFYQQDPTVDVVSREESTITPETFRNAYIKGDRTTVLRAGAPIPILYQKAGAKLDDKPFAELIKDPKYIAATRVDPLLAEAALEAQVMALDKDPATAKRIYAQKYGKNKAWTDQFDRQVVQYYKDNEARNSRFNVISQSIVDPEVNKRVVERLAGRLLDPKRVPVYKIGQDSIGSADEFDLSAEDLFSKDGPAPSVSYVRPGPGGPAAGYQVSTKKGTFVFVDIDTGRKKASDELADGLNPIFFQGKKFGAPMRIGRDERGKPIMGRPEGYYHTNPDNSLEFRLRLHPIDKRGNPTQEPVDVDLQDLYEQWNPEFEGAFGAGATSKAFKLFPLQFEY